MSLRKAVTAALIVVLTLPAQQQLPAGPDQSVLAEGYFVQLENSIEKNESLDIATKYYSLAVNAIASAQPKDAFESRKLSDLRQRVETKYLNRQKMLNTLETQIKSLREQCKLYSALSKLEEAPNAEKRFINLEKSIRDKQKEADSHLRSGTSLAGNCSNRDQVRSEYVAATKINVEIDLATVKVDGNNLKPVPAPCPAVGCGGKCKTTLILLGAAAATVGTICILDSRKGKSCADRAPF